MERTFITLDRKVDEKFGVLDQKIDKKFDTVITKFDGVMHELQSHREEDVAGAEQLRRHDDQLLNHEKRIAPLNFRRDPNKHIRKNPAL